MAYFAGLASRLPRNAARILEIGSSDDHLATTFGRYNPDCHFQTISMDQRQASSDPFSDLARPDAGFDCILHHGYFIQSQAQKTSALKAWDRLLSDNGAVYLTHRNPFSLEAMDLSSLERLDAGKWQRIISSGLNLRRNATLEISATDFHLDTVLSERTVLPQGLGERLTPIIEQFQLDRQALLEILQTQYYSLVLTRRPVRRMLVQSRNLKPVGGVNDVRMTEPFEALRSFPAVRTAEYVNQIPLPPVREDEDRIFIWHRPILTWPDSLTAIRKLRDAGYLLITEFDDHPMVWPKIAENDYLNYLGSHGVQTSTPPLAKLFSEFNPEVALFPNQLRRMPEVGLVETGKTVIFFGALNREDDWAPIMPAINKMLAGLDGDYAFEVVFDRKFFDALETEHKNFTPQCPYDIYLERLAASDICLMPLEDNLFNRMKSDLKLVEAAASGAIPVASPVVYSQTAGHEDFSIICPTPDDFAGAIKVLVKDPERRQKLQQAGRDYVSTKRLQCHQVTARHDWYRSLLARKSELDAALDERLAEYERKMRAKS